MRFDRSGAIASLVGSVLISGLRFSRTLHRSRFSSLHSFLPPKRKEKVLMRKPGGLEVCLWTLSLSRIHALRQESFKDDRSRGPDTPAPSTRVSGATGREDHRYFVSPSLILPVYSSDSFPSRRTRWESIHRSFRGRPRRGNHPLARIDPLDQ